MSLITDQFGNRGIDRHGLGGRGGPDGKLQPDEIDIRSTAQVGGFGPVVKQPPSNLRPKPMYIELDLQNTCDISDLDECGDNINCFVSGDKCKYKVGHTKIQNEWVNRQSDKCESIKDDKCDDNTFCSWNSDKQKCYLTPKYKKLSGLDPNDEFKTKTMDQILGEINNGRVADINIFDNVTKDTRKDVIMSQNNAESSVKGLVEETALSKYFFSNENIDALQQTIRYRVYQKTNEVVDYQSSNELYIIMRSVLLQHGNFRVSAKDLLQEVLQLNKRVEVYAVNEVASNVVQYKGYMKDVEKLPIPIDRPDFIDHRSRNKTYDLSNHISPMATEGWQSRHRSELLK